MKKKLKLIEDYDLELYARNTGEFYAAHCAMAKRDAILVEWVRHVEGPVLKRYRSEIEDLHATASCVSFVARRLMRYYDDHIKEGV
jgi:hypothetical protein